MIFIRNIESKSYDISLEIRSKNKFFLCFKDRDGLNCTYKIFKEFCFDDKRYQFVQNVHYNGSAYFLYEHNSKYLYELESELSKKGFYSQVSAHIKNDINQ